MDTLASSKPKKARKVCKLTGSMACDFPALIANDPYYGGLGGEFIISTSSKTSGSIVLRHEMVCRRVFVCVEYHLRDDASRHHLTETTLFRDTISLKLVRNTTAETCTMA